MSIFPTSQTLASGNFVQDVACGTTKTCFSDCQQATGCTYEAACARAGATAQCTITVKASDLPGDAWVAIGFSSDQKMVRLPEGTRAAADHFKPAI